ncbi:MAG TPA: NADH/ubiquinone/plastoquinone (complex I) [Peptococcaceae bacterium]|nr:NADH/ubiquinone/plastoquinone (complex I) [Peptococcaceae bacterium]
MTEQFPALIVVAPLVAALLVPLTARLSLAVTYCLILVSLMVSLTGALSALRYSLVEGAWHYYFGGWPPPWGIEYVVDPLAGIITSLVGLFGILVFFYSIPFLAGKEPREKGYFYSLYLLLLAGLLGIVATGDVFNLYVFLEISSLAAYALIAFGGHQGVVAGFRYLLVGTAAGTLYLLGVGYTYAVTGSLNMADLGNLLASLQSSRPVILAVALIVTGLGIKMALFPLYGWLPDAYSLSPPGVAPLIAGVMGKVSAYALYRLLYFVFKPGGPVLQVLDVVGWLAAAGIIVGSVMAIAQKEFGRMLAYSSVSQMGYIALGIAIGNAAALTGTLLHIFSHAVAKGCLFMVAGNGSWWGRRKISEMAGMSKAMPLTSATLVVASLSMVGLPPTAGFFSKWYLLMGAVEKGSWIYAVILVISSLLTAIYFFRVLEHVYLKKDPGASLGTPAEEGRSLRGWELAPSMLVPTLLLGLGILALGLFNAPFVDGLLKFSLPWRTW